MKFYFKLIICFIAVVLTVLFAAEFCAVNSSAEKASLLEKDGLKYIQYENGDVNLYSGWTKRADKRFYYKKGKMLKNCWLNKNGVHQSFLTADGSAAAGRVTISGTEYEFDEKGKLVQDEWNIKTEAANVSPSGLTLIITISGDSKEGEFTYGSYYCIERLSGNNWKEVPYIKTDAVIGWTETEYFFDIGENTFKLSWEDMYGKLPKGRYRVCKEIRGYENPDADWRTQKWSEKKYYTYFTIV